MDKSEHMYIPPPGAKKPLRGDRWVALLLAGGALFWLCIWLAVR